MTTHQPSTPKPRLCLASSTLLLGLLLGRVAHLGRRSHPRSLRRQDGDGSGAVSIAEFERWWKGWAGKSGRVRADDAATNPYPARQLAARVTACPPPSGGNGQNVWHGGAAAACAPVTNQPPLWRWRQDMRGVALSARLPSSVFHPQSFPSPEFRNSSRAAGRGPHNLTTVLRKPSRQITSGKASVEELADLFSEVDLDGSGEIDLLEFVTCICTKMDGKKDEHVDAQYESPMHMVRVAIESVRDNVRAIYGAFYSDILQAPIPQNCPSGILP